MSDLARKLVAPRKTGLCRRCVQPFRLRWDGSVGWHRDSERECPGSKLPPMGRHTDTPDWKRDFAIVEEPWKTDGRRKRRLRAVIADASLHRGTLDVAVRVLYETPSGSTLSWMNAADWFRWSAAAWVAA